MKVKNLSFYILMAQLCFCLQAEAGLDNFSPAEITKESTPRYPKERNSDRGGEVSIDDGLVRLIYMIDKNGKAFEPMIDRASQDKFDDEALKSIVKNSFKPAKVGNLIVESRLTSDLVFIFDEADFHDIRGSKGSIADTRRFSLPDGYKSYYDQFTDQLANDQPDQELLGSLLDRMANIKHQSFYSLAYLSLARYRAAKVMNDPLEQMEALQDLVWYDQLVEAKHQVLKGDLQGTVHAALLQLQIEAGHYSEVLQNYKIFSDSDPQIRQMYKDYIAKIVLLQESDQATMRKINIGSRGYGNLPLFKRSFVVEQEIGSLQSLKLRCDRKFKEIAFKVDAQYALPESWGECNLQVIGEPGSVAVLLQQ
jgi:hypothetical protein